jgi:secondary thiamine-phosphate synthase enzyme
MLRVLQELEVETERKTQAVEITQQVREALEDADDASAVVLFVPHTTAGIIIQEHADPAVARDFEKALERIVGDGWGWQHVEAGEENAPSHIRAALTATSVVVPLRDGELALGTWQGIFLCEFDGPRRRTVYVTPLR